jgi:hypothetical protein
VGILTVHEVKQQSIGYGSLWAALNVVKPGVTNPDFDLVVGLGALDAEALADAMGGARALADEARDNGTCRP